MKKFKSSSLPQIIITLITAVFLCFISSQNKAYALEGADVAIYNDSIATAGYSGVWQDGLTAAKNMLAGIGLTYEEITYNDLNSSPQNFSRLYKAILMPGGYAQWYNYWISKAGKTRIRNFVNNGGGYFGICAGSFFAVDRTVWEGVTYDDNAGYNAYGELTGYDLDLFPGSGTGPMNEIADWNTEGYNMTTTNFQTANTVLASYKTIPYTEDILYYGGPYFTPDTETVEILAGYNYNGQPAIVAFNYGAGRVVLSGPHPEIEEDSGRDGVTIAREDVMNDNGSDWALVKYLLNWAMKKTISQTLIPPSSITVPQGGILGPFSSSITNTGNSPSSFYLKSYIKTSAGNLMPVSHTGIITLAAGETLSNNRTTYRVLPVVPAGTTYYFTNVYDPLNRLLDRDYFTFDVTVPLSPSQ